MILNWTILLLIPLLVEETIGKHQLKRILSSEHETLIVTTAPYRKSGITKRAILIGSKVCGRGGLVENNSPLKVEKREDEIDFDALHRDLHPELLNQNQTRTITVPEQQPGTTQVVSKVSKKPQWFERLNRCCVDHEECNQFIPAKQERYNYKNDREYTIYDCKCDDSFAECLKYADSYTADAVGDLYFNVLKMPCINFPKDSNAPATESKNILDKVNEILAKKPGKEAIKDTKNIATSIEDNNGTDGNQRSVSLASLDEQVAAKEREAKHFKRNGHV